ncbi:MAG: GNAT family N-acetyltransferase [Pseudomonadota bacterium]
MVRIVLPTQEIAEKLCGIERKAFAGREYPWTIADYVDFGGPPNRALITDDEISHGLVAVQFAADEAEIINLCVVPEMRRNGLARELLMAAEICAAELGAATLFLEVAADNMAARALYEAADYTEVGRRKDYYLRPDGNRMDALVLRKKLPWEKRA